MNVTLANGLNLWLMSDYCKPHAENAGVRKIESKDCVSVKCTSLERDIVTQQCTRVLKGYTRERYVRG